MKGIQAIKFTISLVVCFGASGLGALFMADDSVTNWYTQLQKPNITPPGWVFGPAWTILYLLMSISVFLVWNKGLDYPKVKLAIGLFLIQLALNAIWTPVFFGFHLILLALIDIILLFIAILVTLLVFKTISFSASVLLVPYLLWVGYATILNGSICYLNQQECFLFRSQKIDKPVTKGLEMKSGNNSTNYNKLTPEEEAIIIQKGTEKPFSGEYYKHREKGAYACKRCNAKLFTSDDKFDSNCGWPSFDDSIPGLVKLQPDKDGIRTEIICNNCGGHLGHVFTGEKLTAKNIRYCVNSLSLNFIPSGKAQHLQNAYFAGGCFWGVEYFFKNAKGVKSTRVGYMGGHKPSPSYKEVCSGTTGHAETLEIVYDPSAASFEELAKLFFEIHDSTQLNRQGSDIGQQYRSVIFYASEEQKETAGKLINILKKKGYDVVTELVKADKFWEAEEYHQLYYNKNNGKPYCHFYKKLF
ncbi:MAG: bifunctional methionine sulfoxide reductase B/A protein [Planctomycetota bacterium]|jgi:peptide methionine sulfoxide reductase msrA/msrB